MEFSSFSTILVLAICLQVCSSYPSHKAKSHKVIDPVPVFVLSMPLEVDEPSNIVEDLPSIKNSPASSEDDDYDSQNQRVKPKRNGIFTDNSDSCCPTVVEMIQPLGGKNRSGDLVELYQGNGVRQRFYEVSCSPSIVERHCRFLDKRHHSNSKCVQQYSYTYALVRDFGVDYEDSANGGWRLDYIQVRSGCSCKVSGSGRHHSGGSYRK